MNSAYLTKWLGRTEECHDEIVPMPIRALAAMLDHGQKPYGDQDSIPPLAHWLSFLPTPQQSRIGPDGHPERGDFLPAVELPRRMWAGGRLHFHRPLRIGDEVSRVSTIADISAKSGKTGQLVFVLVRHEIRNSDGAIISEEQDIVYRDNPTPHSTKPVAISAPQDYHWIREIHPDPILLFRFSALTFNGHRIHYDRRYAQECEGYPGLVVHGPLIATLLVDLLLRNVPNANLESFTFRAISPLFDTASFAVCGRIEADGKTVSLWAKNSEGGLAMSATALLR
ncbi:MaoC family dehydratase N-terminal domain-containing protein [Herbaspirillum sp. GCM10030257]|uniref:FAS1-like dehydratase domain-containing protein n=1 Tax=Herbaspirillum sp. GCM10030257 TaxID=3273393 RepID=UPI00361C3755